MIRTFSRRLLSCTLLATLLLPLAACHGARAKEGFTVPASFDETQDYEITFWAKNDTNINQVNVYNRAVEEFEAIYPNITVNLRLYTNYGDIYNDVITNISTDTTPNVCITYPDHIATYMSGENTVVTLDDLLTDEHYGLGGSEVPFDAPTLEEMVPAFLEECKLGDHYYAVPYMRSTEALYINKTYVEAMGYEIPDEPTWDFVWEVCEKAMEQDANGNYLVNGQSILIPFIYKSTDNMMIQMLRQKNADYSTMYGDILLFNDTTADLLYKISDEVKLGTFSTFKISSYPANFLNLGQCLFAIDSTAGSTWMGPEAPLSDMHSDAKLAEFETVVRQIPQFDTSNPQMISQGPSICIFNKDDPQEVLASWLFVQYLLTNDIQIGYAKTEGYVPVTYKAQQSAEYEDYLSRGGEDNDEYYYVKIEATKLLLDNIDNTFVTPVFNGSASLRDAAGQLIESVVKSTRRKTEINDEYIRQLFAETAALYHLDQGSAGATGTDDLGPLPSTAVMLLWGIVLVWVFIGIYALLGLIRKRKLSKSDKK